MSGRGWEIPSEFSLDPPNSPAVLMHWRALIELLEFMSTLKREALCNLRFPVISGPGLVSPGCPPAVRSVVDRPEVPTDWTLGRMASGGAVKRVLGRG